MISITKTRFLKALERCSSEAKFLTLFKTYCGAYPTLTEIFGLCQNLDMESPVHTLFSLLRQEYPPILTSGEMLSHPGGWDKPIPEVIHLWRHSTSTPNNVEKSRLVSVLDIFCTFLDKNEKNNQSPHWGRDSGIPSSCPRFATSTTRQASSWIANLGHLDGIPLSLPQCGVRFY